MRSLTKNCDRSHKCLTAITAELQQVTFWLLSPPITERHKGAVVRLQATFASTSKSLVSRL